MGYTGTTNYGFQKPAKENAFTVDDLNNAFDKIDETIKDESIKSVSLDTDENDNLILKIIKNNNQDYTDQVSLAAISGSLVVNETMATANMTITKTATSQQIYNGAVTSQTIPTGAGSFKVKITQFGHTIEKDIQVSGETLLDLSEDIVSVTPQSEAISWSIDNTPIPSVEQIKVIKGYSTTIKLVFGNWSDGSEIYNSVTQVLNSNFTTNFETSATKYITESGTFIVPKTAIYEYVMCGGGGGGAGGGGSSSSKPGDGGGGGAGGQVSAFSENLIQGTSIIVTIGAGGSGGAGGIGSDDNPYSTSGSPGGITIFNNHTVNGGDGGNFAGSAYERCGGGGDGGDGSNGQNMTIFGNSRRFGQGGEGANSFINPSEGTPGTTPGNFIDWVSNEGRGGDGGDSGEKATSTYSYGGYGGEGGYGFDSYGRGGNGGRGATVRRTGAASFSNGIDGNNGLNGAVAIRMVV